MSDVLDDYLVDPEVSLLDKTRMQAQVLVPVLRALRAELGKDQADAVVRQALRDWSRQLFAAIGDGIGGSPRRRWATIQKVFGGISGREVDFEVRRQDEEAFRHRRHALPLRRVLPRAGRARARRAADLRGGPRLRGRQSGDGEPRAKPDDHAGRAELHLPLQIRTALSWSGVHST